MITGANSGLGKEAARQFARQKGVEKIYLACRNEVKAESALRDLQASTGKDVFEIVLMDMMDLESIRSAVQAIDDIDALVMNAGGSTKTSSALTEYGVTEIFAQNVLGHVVLVKELLKGEKLHQVALYAGSEAARGIPKMGIKPPTLQSGSEREFASICDGSFFPEGQSNPMIDYRFVKYVAAMWMSSMARNHPKIKFVTVSPGNTSGTGVFDVMPAFPRFMMKNVVNRLLPLFGLVHGIEAGAKRYVEGVMNSAYVSGVFYGSRLDKVTGSLVDQADFAQVFASSEYQENAHKAINTFLAAS
jgi:NAD(P)-dependent dehydrogenase (short-subunit alcohol dehydrogenase family)